MIKKKIIAELAQERIDELAKDSLFIVSIDISSANHIKVVLDGDTGVRIEQCISVSRNIEHNLDREVQDFSLEVTSFSLSDALVMDRQFAKYINKNIDILTHDNNKKIAAKLLEYSPQEIKIELQLSKKQIKAKVEPIVTLSFDDIKEIKSLISFK